MTGHQAAILTDERAVELVASRPDLLARAIIAYGTPEKTNGFALTARQKEVLDFIRQYSTKEGIAPSYDEIRIAVGLKSKSGVFRIVNALVERGRIIKLPNRDRCIALVEAAA